MNKLNAYQRVALLTVLATLFLILVGGLVRAAGAGLGCPDWPKCFGVWIPPTNVADLPAGFDPTLFNPVHTWLEYINRLIGVLIGFLILLTFALSFRYRKTDPIITISSAAAFVFVLFQGWLGGQVVRSGLEAGMITIHMVMAMVIVNVLLYATYRANRERWFYPLDAKNRSFFKKIGITLLAFTMVQLILGTQVREMVDVVKNTLDLPREMWLDTENLLYRIHRSFSWIVLILAVVLFFKIKKEHVQGIFRRLGITIVMLIILQMFMGLGMERLGMPGVFQLLHLVSVAVLICAEFLFVLISNPSSQMSLRARTRA
jgi:cytochrome c oxidase assembly protein subunit 15